MMDQATRLRGLMESRLAELGQHSVVTEAVPSAPKARTLVVTSGKGGVGKTVLALNLALALQQAGKRVCLMDANFGLANVDLLCGLNGYWNLEHVLSGARTLKEVMLQGPGNLTVLSGGAALAEPPERFPLGTATALQELKTLESQFDYLVIDAGCGLYPTGRAFLAAADVGLVATTPEPTAIADAYATFKATLAQPPSSLVAVVNQATTASQAAAILERLRQTARMFLNLTVTDGGYIPRDPLVPRSVAQRIPLLCGFPRSASAESLLKLARRLLTLSESRHLTTSFLLRLQRRGPLQAA